MLWINKSIKGLFSWGGGFQWILVECVWMVRLFWLMDRLWDLEGFEKDVCESLWMMW